MRQPGCLVGWLGIFFDMDEGRRMKKMLALVLVILAFFVNVNARAGINDGLVA